MELASNVLMEGFQTDLHGADRIIFDSEYYGLMQNAPFRTLEPFLMTSLLIRKVSSRRMIGSWCAASVIVLRNVKLVCEGVDNSGMSSFLQGHKMGQ